MLWSRYERDGGVAVGASMVGIMWDYEIRIVKKDKGSIIYVGPQASDGSAVRQAQAFSREEDRVEVWRDDVCLYSRNAKSSLPFIM